VVLPAQAQEIALPAPGIRVALSPSFTPPVLKGVKVHPDDPFRFDFIMSPQGTAEDATRLIKYFLASLTIPEKDLWVNLSPYEKDRIVPEGFGRTEMGRDLLAQDYLLKQITASLIYPEEATGKEFWKRVYEEAAQKFGTTDIPVNTFNKVWIVPEKAVVYENTKAGTAYVVESRLKVMLESDYLAASRNGAVDTQAGALGKQIVREVVIPQLTREVNEGRNFAQLRQVYNSFILATWYKKKIKDSILNEIYSDHNKTVGVAVDDPQEKQRIYERYLQAFKKGAYNYIKEEQDPSTGQVVPRKYFSGGVNLDWAMTSQAMDFTGQVPDGLEATEVLDVQVNIAAAENVPAQRPGIVEGIRAISDGGTSLPRKVALLEELWQERSPYRNLNIPETLSVKVILAFSKNTAYLWSFITGDFSPEFMKTLMRYLALTIEEKKFIWSVFHLKHPEWSNRDGNLLKHRAKIAAMILKRGQEGTAKISVLDAGSGPDGTSLKKLKVEYGERVDAFGIDLNIDPSVPSQGVHLEEGDVERMRYPDGSFDIVNESFLMGYFMDLEEFTGAIREFMRVLKDGGIFIHINTNEKYGGKENLAIILAELGYTVTIESGNSAFYVSKLSYQKPRADNETILRNIEDKLREHAESPVDAAMLTRRDVVASGLAGFAAALSGMDDLLAADSRDPLLMWMRSATFRDGMPRSFEVPSDRDPFWNTIVGFNHTDGPVERRILRNGLSIYDASLWQMALASSGDRNNVAAADLVTRTLSAGRWGELNLRASSAPFVYGGQSLPPNQAFFLRIMSSQFMNEDPLSPDVRDQWKDWQPIMGENAWGAIMGPLQVAYVKYARQIPVNSAEVRLAQSIVPALRALTTRIGAILHVPAGTFDQSPDDISNENNISIHAALRMLYEVTKDGRYLDMMRGIEDYLKRYGMNREAGVLYQGGSANGEFVPNAGQFAVDVQTWAIVSMGPGKLDEMYGSVGTAFRMWQQTKMRAGYYVDGQLFGVGYTKGNDVFSGEWTAGAVAASLELALHYQRSNPAWAEEALKDAQSMVRGLEQLSKKQGDRKSYLYANRRFFIPFAPGWWSNALPSLASTAWVYFIQNQFNPFRLGGASEWGTLAPYVRTVNDIKAGRVTVPALPRNLPPAINAAADERQVLQHISQLTSAERTVIGSVPYEAIKDMGRRAVPALLKTLNTVPIDPRAPQNLNMRIWSIRLLAIVGGYDSVRPVLAGMVNTSQNPFEQLALQEALQIMELRKNGQFRHNMDRAMTAEVLDGLEKMQDPQLDLTERAGVLEQLSASYGFYKGTKPIPETLKIKILTHLNRSELLFFITGDIYLNTMMKLEKEAGLTEEEEAFLWPMFNNTDPEYSERAYNLSDSLGVIDALIAARGKVSVLDAGCGPNARSLRNLKGRYRDKVDATGLDIDIEPGQVEGVRLVKGNVRHMEFPDESFDLVNESYLLVHFPRAEEFTAALKEIMRVLKKGGVFVSGSETPYSTPDQFKAILKDLGYDVRIEGKYRKLYIYKAQEDEALTGQAKGGIDLNAGTMDLDVRSNGEGIALRMDPARLKQLQQAPGFVPVIINIAPVADLKAFLEV